MKYKVYHFNTIFDKDFRNRLSEGTKIFESDIFEDVIKTAKFEIDGYKPNMNVIFKTVDNNLVPFKRITKAYDARPYIMRIH